MRSVIVALAFVALVASAQGAIFEDIAVLDCEGGVHFLPDSPLHVKGNGALIKKAYDMYFDALYERAVCRCPEMTKAEFKRRWMPQDPFTLLYYAQNNVNPLLALESDCDASAFSPKEHFGWFSFNTPDSCSYEAYVNNGEPCLMEFSPTDDEGVSLGVDIQVAVDSCPNSNLPFVSISCSGDACQDLLKPCQDDDDCTGGMTCTDIASGDNLWADIASGFRDAHIFGSQQTEDSCGGVDSLILEVTNYLRRFWDGQAMTQARLAVCLHESIADPFQESSETRVFIRDLESPLLATPVLDVYDSLDDYTIEGPGTVVVDTEEIIQDPYYYYEYVPRPFALFKKDGDEGDLSISRTFPEAYRPFRIDLSIACLGAEFDWENPDIGRVMGSIILGSPEGNVVEIFCTIADSYYGVNNVAVVNGVEASWPDSLHLDWDNGRVSFWAQGYETVDLVTPDASGINSIQITHSGYNGTEIKMEYLKFCTNDCEYYNYDRDSESDDEFAIPYVTRTDVVMDNLNAWDGVLDSGELANSAARKAGTAAGFDVPAVDLKSGPASGTKQEWIRHTCDNTLMWGFDDEMGLAAQAVYLNAHIDFFHGWLFDIVECRASEDDFTPLTEEQFNVQFQFWQMANMLYQVAVEHSFALGEEIDNFMFFDASDRMHMPVSCSFDRALAGQPCGMLFWAFSELLGFDTDVVVYHDKCDDHEGLPTGALEVDSILTDMIKAPIVCTEANEATVCPTGTVCTDMGGNPDADYNGNPSDPQGSTLWSREKWRVEQSTNPDTGDVCYSTERSHADFRHYVHTMSNLGPSDGSSDLWFCTPDFDYINDVSADWAEERIDATGDTFAVVGLDAYSGPFLAYPDFEVGNGDDDDISATSSYAPSWTLLLFFVAALFV